MKKTWKTAACGLGLAGIAAYGLLTPVSRSQRTFSYLTPTYFVDKIYPSMTGPSFTNQELLLDRETSEPELLWITGYQATMVGEDGLSAKPQQFMCHNTLTIRRGLDQHRQLFGAEAYGTRRLFTLSQGQYSVALPEGFGIPIVSSENVMLQSQVLNLNEDSIGDRVRHQVKVDFLRDREASRPLKPLAMFFAGIQVRAGDPAAAEMPKDPVMGCALPADRTLSGHNELGQELTGHWILDSGREVRRTTLKHQFPFDTTVHYIAVHMHPYAVSLELRDKTTGKSLWKAIATQSDKGTGLATLSHYSSQQGFEVYRDHVYEIESVYSNTSGQPQSAMAFMFFYAEDKMYRAPDVATLRESDESFCGPLTDPTMLR